jgi:hypothetical protein
MANNTQTQSGGIGFFGLLAIVFITLKLTDYIAWSWWWVLSPLWGPLAIVLAIGLIALVILGFIKVFK